MQVIFRIRATNHRALLQKTTYKDKASYGSPQLVKTPSCGGGLENVAVCVKVCAAVCVAVCAAVFAAVRAAVFVALYCSVFQFFPVSFC